MDSSIIIHSISPVYDQNSQVLLLGTMPSPKSREAGFFYGHPQNRMWPVLSRLFGEDVPASTEDRRTFLLRHHIAMWDVLASCAIRGADDSSIRNPVPNDLRPILEAAPIAAIFTTGKKLIRSIAGTSFQPQAVRLFAFPPPLPPIADTKL